MGETFENHKKTPQLSTSVKSGGVINVCSYEGRLGLSADGVVPHPPDATLKERFSVKTTVTHSWSERRTAQVTAWRA